MNLAKQFDNAAQLKKSENAQHGEGLPMGNISQHSQTSSDYDGTEGAVVLGVSRYGRRAHWRPQSE